MPFFDQPMPPAMPGRPPYEHDVVKNGPPKSRRRMVLCLSRRNTTTAPPQC
jgi:hypothetical protein